MPRPNFWQSLSFPYHLNWQSLQVRLTIGLTVVSVISLGSMSIWIAWSFDQILVSTHKYNIEQVARRFPRDVVLYSDMLPVDQGVQKTINDLSTSQLLIWVDRADGSMLAQSSVLAMSPDLMTSLRMIADVSIKPQLYRVQNRQLVLCGGSLILNSQTVGRFYVVQDITSDLVMLESTLRNLMGGSALAIVITAIVIAIYIRRSMKPLRELNRIAGAISADDLGSARLNLDYAPSEVKEMATTMDMMLSRLYQSWEQQRQFVSNVSHELRTPLTIVQGYLQSLLRRSATLSDLQREALETAAAETGRTIRMLQDLLDLARADNNYLQVPLEIVDLNDLVMEVASMTERVSDRPLLIETDLPGGRVIVKANHDRLKQVLINLIDNAIKYSQPDQPIHLRMIAKPDQVLLQVQDHGEGIPLHHQSRIFERFYRVDDTRSRGTGGTGLGLAIVKTLVEGMGNTISVQSKPNVGTTFTITLTPA